MDFRKDAPTKSKTHRRSMAAPVLRLASKARLRVIAAPFLIRYNLLHSLLM